MAPTRKSRSVNKRFSDINEVSPDKDEGNAGKSMLRKRKLSDMLGSPWSKDELERFYEAYRKYGRDWKKVARVVHNRSVEMVETLYNMNRAYLSLPEGTASVVGLVALMTDHYNSLEGSGSERESNDEPLISRKPQKLGRGKVRLNMPNGLDGHFPDLLQSPSVAPKYDCPSLLKKRRSGGSRPRAVGKRTPRFLVSYSYNKNDEEKYVSPNKHGLKSEVDGHDDEVAHIALALAKASQRGGCPQVSQTSSKRTEHIRHSPVLNGEEMRAESAMTNAKLGTSIEEDRVEDILGSREEDCGDYARDASYLVDTEGVGKIEVLRKGKKFHGKKPKFEYTGNSHVDEVKEACSGIGEGLGVTNVRGKAEIEVTDAKTVQLSSQCPRKRSKKLCFEDESSAFDALQALADLSLMMPASTIESGAKEKGHHSVVGLQDSPLKNSSVGRDSSPDVSAFSEVKQRPHQSTTKLQKKKRKSLATKSPKADNRSDSHLCEPQKTEASAADGKKIIRKFKHTSQSAPEPKQGKSDKPAERSSSTTDQRTETDSAVSTVQVPTVNEVNLPAIHRNRRKMNFQKPQIRKKLNSSENYISVQLNKYSPLQDRGHDLKEKLSDCLSPYLVRRWCSFEWFYSAIDYPWFAKREFVEYLNHVGLGHVPRLTRVEWDVIRSSLGKPRRLSEQFLREEKEKLKQYRESVRTHYIELRAGTREGLPTDLARPLSVGQCVIAIHPRTREIHDGSVLTVDRNKCMIQFDRAELGVEFVMDIDCMPSNPLENMPEALSRQSVALDRYCENFNEPKVSGQSKERKTGQYMKFAPNENLEKADAPSLTSSSTYPLNNLLRQVKEDSVVAFSLAKAVASDIINVQQLRYIQPCTPAQIQSKEADIGVLSELNRALDKKEALVLELRHMNDEVSQNQKDGDNSLKDSVSFKKQYATVVKQLKEANDQVASALLCLRQRNTFQGNSPPLLLKPVASSGCPPGSFDQSASHNQESGSHVIEIVESSRMKAQTMIDAAIQAVSSLKDGEDAFARIREALDSINIWHFVADSGIPSTRSSTPPDTVHGSLSYHDQSTSSISEPMITGHEPGSKLDNASNQMVAQIPSELISSCVATLLMIQTCTVRQYPPAEVAQILDTAVTSLQPCSSQNLPIYQEIQMCMGIIKTQIRARVPT